MQSLCPCKNNIERVGIETGDCDIYDVYRGRLQQIHGNIRRMKSDYSVLRCFISNTLVHNHVRKSQFTHYLLISSGSYSFKTQING